MKTACTSRIGLLNPRALIGFALYAAGLVLVFGATSAVGGDNAVAELSAPGPAQATGGTWTVTGELGVPRSQHTATLLPDGKVLVTGGNRDHGALASAQLYHPAIGSWQRIANMNHKRNGHTATLLSNGQVLVTGGTPCGANCPPGPRGHAELYDPTTRTWTDTGNLASARWFATATLLPNGQVLVAGGLADGFVFLHALDSAELYDPNTGVWTATGSMTTGRSRHTATLLPNGQVLVAAGDTYLGIPSASAELYDPATGVWTATGSLATSRFQHTATLLPNGRVLVAGGYHGPNYSASSELYDPATGMWRETGSMAHERSVHTATLLPNGQVLVAGGIGNGFPSPFWASAELYDPATGMWTTTSSMATARGLHTATLLPNGQVLVAGGIGDGFVSLPSAELYEPAP